MLRLTHGFLVQSVKDLPAVPKSINCLYADFETSSGDPGLTSVNPWMNCTAIGVAVAFDDSPIWFVPREFLVTGWWKDVLAVTDTWVNHNVKYDMHVSANDLQAPPVCKVACTLTLAKLIDSDYAYKGGYGLDNLSKRWIEFDIDQFGWNISAYTKYSKDYGDIPLDLLADYACADVESVRRLYAYEMRVLPADSSDVWRTERSVTKTLFNMEQRGVKIDLKSLDLMRARALYTMLTTEEALSKVVGRSFNPSSNKECFDVLCNQFGLPVLSWTDGVTPQPSFDKEALELYSQHPDAPSEILELMLKYRKTSIIHSLFLEKWGECHRDSFLHPNYNQCVRTGRMSCSDPNLQQVTGSVKHLIVPPEGYGIITADYSQIEFRVIVHYLENAQCIAAYKKDPWTDFHSWVAEMVPTKRRPAKTINFMMGYGGGKARALQVLSLNKDVVGEVVAEIDKAGVRDEARASAIRQACEARAAQVFNKYHALLPELKSTSRMASNACRAKGFVRNHYGRRRHLPLEFSHRAFNAACQSTAGDMMKERMVALEKEVPEFLMTMQVHDQVVGVAPLEMLKDDSLLKRIVNVMNAPERPLIIPIRTSIGWSDTSWGHASKEERELKFT